VAVCSGLCHKDKTVSRLATFPLFISVSLCFPGSVARFYHIGHTYRMGSSLCDCWTSTAAVPVAVPQSTCLLQLHRGVVGCW
jgi:hypothetical protein